MHPREALILTVLLCKISSSTVHLISLSWTTMSRPPPQFKMSSFSVSISIPWQFQPSKSSPVLWEKPSKLPSSLFTFSIALSPLFCSEWFLTWRSLLMIFRFTIVSIALQSLPLRIASSHSTHLEVFKLWTCIGNLKWTRLRSLISCIRVALN